MSSSPYQAISKQAAAEVLGIPNPKDFGKYQTLTAGKLYDLFVQRHEAERAGPHHDLRIGDPKLGLLSWTLPKGLPQPGKKHLAIRQPLHEHGYGAFHGEIPEGYGKGQVESERTGQVLITKVSPAAIHLTTADKRYPERYVLLAPREKTKNWLMLNVTPTETVPYKKIRYKSIPANEVEPILKQMNESVQAKIDGASALISLMDKGPEVTSYRVSKVTKNPIVHTERIFGGRPEIKLPKELQGTVLKGEVYGVDRTTGKAIPVQTLSGLLNAGLAKSLEKQRAQGTELKTMLYDIQRLGKKPVDANYQERYELVKEITEHLPSNKFHVAEQATTPAEARSLFEKIRSGKHPLTHEGIVIHSDGKPIKAKFKQDTDVYLTGWRPGKGKYTGAAGSLTYALKKGEPTIGRIGTGFTDKTRKDIAEDPEGFVGRWAKIISQSQLPSGAFRTPIFHGLHEDLPMAKAAETQRCSNMSQTNLGDVLYKTWLLCQHDH